MDADLFLIDHLGIRDRTLSCEPVMCVWLLWWMGLHGVGHSSLSEPSHQGSQASPYFRPVPAPSTLEPNSEEQTKQSRTQNSYEGGRMWPVWGGPWTGGGGPGLG